jgi:serine/threonine-protein kinase
MSEPNSTLSERLPVNELLRVDSICQRFETAWLAAAQSGSSPRVEEYLTDAEDAIRELLLRQLVLLDVEYRHRRGERPSADDYQARFPSLGRAWLEAEVREPAALLGSRYRLGAALGQGAMGTVSRARDSTLDRDVAYKILREEHRGRPDLERRFEDEARICGRLQHPGIVPIYEMGRAEDTRPFFTMKVVEGRTLNQLLAERAFPADGLPRFLGVFEHICQAVGYAHCLGVIHRDLKPANIMVGAFGEVQVMDWGFAKVLDRRLLDAAQRAATTVGPEPTELPIGSTADSRGSTGVVGTPSYLPPEQARGESQDADERSDVFGLGAILCVILSGEPPFLGGCRDEVLARAAAGDVAETLARLDGCGADAELVALCKECLAPRAEERPPNGGDVAARVAAYQTAVQNRLHKLELERIAAEAKATEAKATAAAERKARQRTRALALAVVLLMAGGGIGAWLWQQQQADQAQRWQQQQTDQAQRRRLADVAVGPTLGEARRLRNVAKKAGTLDDLRKMRQALSLAQQAEEVAHSGGASPEVQEEAAALAHSLKEEAGAAERDIKLLTALLEVRGPREQRFVANAKGHMKSLGETSAEDQFKAAFHNWDPTFDPDALPVAVAAAGLRTRSPVVVTEVIAALDEWASERQRQPKAGRSDWQRLNDLAADLDDTGPGRRELRALLAGGSLQRERALGALSSALRPVPVPFDAAPRPAREQLRRLVAAVNPATEPILGLLILSRALQEAGEELAAERLLDRAVDARPHEVTLVNTLGQLFESQERWGKAAVCYRLLRALRPEFGVALAYALFKDGAVDEAIALYTHLSVEHPNNPALHDELGGALLSQGRYKEAEAEYCEALRLMPDSPEIHSNFSHALRGQGRYKEAEAQCREAIRLNSNSAVNHTSLAIALDEQGRHKESEAECRVAIRLKPDDAYAHTNLGVALRGQNRYKEAEAEHREAIRLMPDSPEVHTNLGVALRGQGRYKEAEAEQRQAIRIKPDYAVAHINLGNALSDQSRFKEAEAEYREAIRIMPDFALAHINLGNALSNQGRYKEAEEAYREANRLNSRNGVRAP